MLSIVLVRRPPGGRSSSRGRSASLAVRPRPVRPSIRTRTDPSDL